MRCNDNFPTGMAAGDIPDCPDPWEGHTHRECRFQAVHDWQVLCLCECMTGGMVAGFDIVPDIDGEACECFEPII